MSPFGGRNLFVIVTVTVVTLSILQTCAFELAYTRHKDGRKLFGGYRIVPRSCSATSKARQVVAIGPPRSRHLPNDGPQVCMFNYECARRQGEVVGTCMDGFLFGACCRLPSGTEVGPSAGATANGITQDFATSTTNTFTTTTTTTTSSSSSSNNNNNNNNNNNDDDNEENHLTFTELVPNPSQHIWEHPGAETILLHPNGSEVVQTNSPSDFEPNTTPPVTTTPELSTFTIVSSGNSGSHYITHPDIIDDATTSFNYNNNNNNNNNNNESTEEIESLDTTSETVTPTYYMTSRWTSRPTPGFRPKPTTTSTGSTKPNLILVPTYSNSATSGGTKKPSPPKYTLTTNTPQDSIHHIINILDENQPVIIESTPAGLSTWHGHTPSPTWRPTTLITTSVKVPSTRPSINTGSSTSASASSVNYGTSPAVPAPTVIVLGPLTSDYASVVGGNTPTYWTQASFITKKPSTVVTSRPTTSIQTKRPSTKPISSSYRPTTTTVTTKRPSTIITRRPTSQTTTTTTTTTRRPTTINARPTTPNRKPATIKPKPKPTTTTTTPQVVNDLNVNFPPVRNPGLNVTQPTEPNGISTESYTETNAQGDIIVQSTDNVPEFIEDPAMDHKLEVFVNKIVNSLHGNFQVLQDVIYDRQNISAISTVAPPTKKPTNEESETTKPTKKPNRRPTTIQTTTPTITTTSTKRPNVKPIRTTTKRTKRPTTPPTQQHQTIDEDIATNEVVGGGRPTTVVVNDAQIDSTSQKPVNYKNECGIRPHVKKNGRIVGGTGASFGEFPWQVLVRETTWLGLFTKNKCGGVLITNRYVITAAHCQPGFLANLVAVFGEYDISGDLEAKRSITKNVRRVIVHRNYDPATFANDLALLELDTPVVFDSHILPICMPQDEDDFTGRMATVSGWGRLKYGGGVPSVLQEVHVPIMENSVCQEMFQTAGHKKVILESFLCAGYANGQKDSCEGDSGGPLMVEREDGRWVLVGTVSHGIKCAAPYLPGVYMRTQYYKPWFKIITGVEG